MQPGVDKIIDLFTYPWDLPSDSFDGAIISHVCEHIPHEPKFGLQRSEAWPDMKEWLKRETDLQNTQDGWFTFFSELYRVLTNGAIVYILSPFAWSQGGITDPTHTRYLTPETFSHSMRPDQNAPFAYSTGGIHFELTGSVRYMPMEHYAHLVNNPERFGYALQHEINVATDFSLTLECVK